MTWLLLTFWLFVWTATILLRALSAKRSRASPVLLTTIFFVISQSAVLAYGLLVLDGNWQDMVAIIPHLLVATIALIIGRALMFKSLSYLDASLHTILSQLMIIVAIIVLGYFLLGETLYGLQWLGTGAVLAGLAVNHIASWHNSKLVHGFVYALLAAILTSISIVIWKIMLNTVGLGTILAFGPIAIISLSIVFYISWQKSHKLALIPKGHHFHWPLIICGGFVNGLSAVAYFSSLDAVNNVAYIAALSGVALAMAVAAEIILLREYKQLRNKLIGLLLAVVGLILLA